MCVCVVCVAQCFLLQCVCVAQCAYIVLLHMAPMIHLLRLAATLHCNTLTRTLSIEHSPEHSHTH